MLPSKRKKSEYGDNKEPHPQYSKLYVGGFTDKTEEQLEEIFQEYGTVSEVFVLKEKGTGNPSGSAFIKYTTRSAAAKAQDELNGKSLPGLSKPVKISPATGTGHDPDLAFKLKRLFIKVPDDLDMNGVKEVFENYGQVKEVTIVTDKRTGKPKGLAYVTYTNLYDAAVAMESCDHKYKPVYAEVRNTDRRTPVQRSERLAPATQRYQSGRYSDDAYNDYSLDSYRGGYREPRPLSDVAYYAGERHNWYIPRNAEERNYRPEPLLPERPSLLGEGTPRFPERNLKEEPFPRVQQTTPQENPMMSIVSQYPENGPTRLHVRILGQCSESMVNRLFGVIPGLEYCDVNFDPVTQTANAHVKYSTSQSAAYAKEKWDRFEYPPGCPLGIVFK